MYTDGTGQIGGIKPEQRLSNICKMYRASKVGPENTVRPDKQVAFYDPGLLISTGQRYQRYQRYSGFGRAAENQRREG